MEQRGRFVETRWTMVLAAGSGSPAEAEEALSELCQIYWRPLFAFIRAQGYAPAEAEDLTQGFFERVIARRDLAAADPARGRFRSFLLASVKHFLSNARDRERALKRGGGRIHLPLDRSPSDERPALPEPATHLTPEAQFEHHWLEAVLARVLGRLESEVEPAKQPLVRHLAGALTGDDEMPVRELGASLGLSDGAARVALHRLRRRLRDLLREEIAQTVADPSDVEDELRHLMAIASRDLNGPRAV